MKKMTFVISSHSFLGTFHFHAKWVELIIQNSQKNPSMQKSCTATGEIMNAHCSSPVSFQVQ